MTTTLSRVVVDPAHRAARKALSSPAVLHAIVMTAFGDAAGTGRPLWRLDHGADRHTLYVVGPGRPDAAHLAEQLGTAAADIGSFSYERFLGGLAAEQEWRFRLRANPTKALSQPNARSKRIPLLKEADQLAWLIRQGRERAGYEIPTNRLQVPEVIIRNRGADEFRRQSATVTLGTVVYDGVLRVTDADALRAALISGIGRGKAYGCGLLTLAPISSQS
jgi:CRISPR system Cascade subunit CasE